MVDPMMQVVAGALSPGTQVGSWRVGEVLGRGGYATVYSAEQVEPGTAGRFALKLATWPRDPRFAREVELLTRVRHPQVPRLHGHGWWTHPSGAVFPFLVMDRLEGEPLYEWAERRKPSLK